ncbi:hypothetical protein [Paraliobacillus ryukyuensis]|uniref:hypothetical protein n=1 Tax=Paraliobacillus ryukyuensis TaxID=200904 RepID=UPI0009A601FC|nr:hypothetical protein [Paraliobacillus ryukyuensis]
MILPENLKRRENESDIKYKVRLCVAKLNKDIDLDWVEINQILGLNQSGDHTRKLAYGYKEIYDDNPDLFEKEIVEDDKGDLRYKETIEIMSDGSHKSDKLLRMSDEQSKSVEFLLEAHGYDPSEWELTNAKNNIWNVYSKQDGIQTLYSSKITAKPSVTGFNVDDFLEKANNKIVPIHIKNKIGDGTDLLELPLYDMHFGVNDYEYYRPVRDAILEKIKSKRWDKIFFIIGQDLLHNNNFKGETSSGTPIEKVDMDKAWEDAFKFYCELINEAQNNSNSVDCSYSIANHDDSMAWAFVKCLEIKFPDVNFDTSKKVRKAYVWNGVFIGYAHGHKGANRLHENFISDFGKQMALADIVEIHSGHLHTEKAKDKFGVLVRTLSTKGKTDSWHEDNGFVGANKRFQVFEYSPTDLKAIHYI